MPDTATLSRPDSESAQNGLRDALIVWKEAEARAALGGPMQTFFEWMKAYPMNPHAELGRVGVVCPFTKQAKKIDSMRLAMFATRPEEEAAAYAIVREAFLEMDRIPVAPGSEEFRTVVLAFPECDSEAGLAMLKRVIKRLKYFALFGFRTVGFMHKESEETGLWNPNFRPLRAPMPVLALRYVVEQDAPFIARYHLMWGPYLMRYGLGGARRLFGERVKRSARTASG